MSDYRHAVKNLYKYKNENILIGLTGRTGAGCSTVAKILKTKTFEDLHMQEILDANTNEDHIQSKIIHDYLSTNNRWYPFTIIEVSNIILSFALEKGIDELIKYIRHEVEEKQQETNFVLGNIKQIMSILQTYKKYFDDIKQFSLNEDLSKLKKEKLNNFYDFYFKSLSNFKSALKKELKVIICNKITRSPQKGITSTRLDLYTFLMQKMGNNLRACGDCLCEEVETSFSYVIENRIEKLIQLVLIYNHQNNCGPLRICIDALRNPMEILYFKDRYSYFYMFSVNTDEEERRRRLNNLNAEELENLDIVEYPQKYKYVNELFYHQDIQKCIEFSNIHIYNEKIKNGKYTFLTEQIIRYITLIIHPGLVNPTKEEFCMQLAYNAKFNSGCLSRQVGAVVTSDDYSIRAIGWNDAPAKQLPCNLRDIPSYCKYKKSASYSEFEIQDSAFQNALETINDKIKETDLIGMHYCYCFKDIYNALENNKNQVHTRSLHAEENAFLQISKYGGQSIKGGRLFVTASPCELCSKKSYQLGIKHIYYIDPYPGIAHDHILKFGEKNNDPKVHLFKGAVGETYVSIYSQRLAPKDELEYITGIKNKEVVNEIYKPKIEEIKFSDIVYKSITVNFIFKSRTEITCKAKYVLIPKIKNIKRLEFITSWTGSSFDDIKCKEYALKNYATGNDTCHKYSVEFGNELEVDKEYEYSIETIVRDEKLVMVPYISQKIKHLVESLKIQLTYNKEDKFINEDTITHVIYADFEMKQQLQKTAAHIQIENEKKCSVYEVKSPNLNYCYGIEWEFTKNT